MSSSLMVQDREAQRERSEQKRIQAENCQLGDAYLKEGKIAKYNGVEKKAPKDGWYKLSLNTKGKLTMAPLHSRTDPPPMS